MKKLLLVAISGVQSYISQARKTSDLYIGSKQILDELTFIKDKCCNIKNIGHITEVLLPSNSKDCKSNFFIAEYESEQNYSNEKIEEVIEEHLINIGEDNVYKDLTCFIVVEDYELDVYDVCYKKLYSKYQAYKKNRLKAIGFQDTEDRGQVQTEGKKKCTLCGIRLGYIVRPKSQNKPNEIKEYLCQECFKKESEMKGKKFPSTEEIANDSGYYALVQIDIDDMGYHLSENQNEMTGIDLLKYQKALSEKVMNIFDKLKQKVSEVEDANSKKMELVIYAGGDDMLFFCPLNNVWNIIQELDSLFQEKELQMTCTKSIIIAHAKEPLRYVINESRKQLEGTKQYYQENGKNGIGLTWIYHSGGKKSVYMQDRESKLVVTIRKLILTYSKGELSKSLLFELEEEMIAFGKKYIGEDYINIIRITEMEIGRVLKRKTRYRGEKLKEIHEDFIQLLRPFIDFKGRSYIIDFNGYFDLIHIIQKWGSSMEESKNGKNNS